VGARDQVDRLLAAPGAFGVLGAALDRVTACLGAATEKATLVLAAGDHPVADLGVTPFRREVTAEVLAAARAGSSLGVTAAVTAGLAWEVVDGGSSSGDLATSDAMSRTDAADLVARGVAIGERLGATGLVALGEVGVGNTTVAAALTAIILDLDPADAVGLGSGADAAMLERKRSVVGDALARYRQFSGSRRSFDLLAALGGPEFALLCGVTIGAARTGGVVVLDGLATTVAAAMACELEPGVGAHLVAGQRSNEAAHSMVLRHLGLEPLIDLRLRAGEGVGAVMACRLILDGMQIRRATAVTE
jgi:nicotinate-nucleotide--dimethylbenzimidazole phosphoribosyltransferase